MPLGWAALYGQGAHLYIVVWSDGLHDPIDITRFMFKAAQSCVICTYGLMCKMIFLHKRCIRRP